MRPKVVTVEKIFFGDTEINLAGVEQVPHVGVKYKDSVENRQDFQFSSCTQLVEISQTRAIGDALVYIKKHINDKNCLRDVLSLLESELNRAGTSVFDSKIKHCMTRCSFLLNLYYTF